jgi:hypothetical protein
LSAHAEKLMVLPGATVVGDAVGAVETVSSA